MQLFTSKNIDASLGMFEFQHLDKRESWKLNILFSTPSYKFEIFLMKIACSAVGRCQGVEMVGAI
jgi:hypothetical protein